MGQKIEVSIFFGLVRFQISSFGFPPLNFVKQDKTVIGALKSINSLNIFWRQRQFYFIEELFRYQMNFFTDWFCITLCFEIGKACFTQLGNVFSKWWEPSNQTWHGSRCKFIDHRFFLLKSFFSGIPLEKTWQSCSVFFTQKIEVWAYFGPILKSVQSGMSPSSLTKKPLISWFNEHGHPAHHHSFFSRLEGGKMTYFLTFKQTESRNNS